MGEVAHRRANFHRHEQKGAYHHKERYADSAQSSIEDGHPQAVALVGKHRGVGRPAIEILTRMNEHHEETCDHSDVVDENDSFVHIYKVIKVEYLSSVKNRHLVRQVDSQFYQSSNLALCIIPGCLMQELVLTVTDNLVGVTLARLYHVADHRTRFLPMAIIEILANYIAITIDGTLVLIEHDALLIAYGCCDVGNVFEIVKLFLIHRNYFLLIIS